MENPILILLFYSGHRGFSSLRVLWVSHYAAANSLIKSTRAVLQLGNEVELFWVSRSDRVVNSIHPYSLVLNRKSGGPSANVCSFGYALRHDKRDSHAHRSCRVAITVSDSTCTLLP